MNTALVLKEGTKLGSFNVIQEAHPDTHRKTAQCFNLIRGNSFGITVARLYGSID
ncbi:MAG: hypothetical protein KL787_08990 [Taibaiella sp.]|nr:hypothetical protein [Taibaiella sp.]